MTKTLIIYAHPYEKSFNYAILQRVRQIFDEKGEAYSLIDLYQDGFNPVYTKEELALFKQGKALDPLVLGYQQMLQESNRLIFIFPIWWNDCPAIVKGFFDKVFLKTFAFDENKIGILEGKLTHIEQALMITTAGSPTWYLKLFSGNAIGRTMDLSLKDIGVQKRKWVNCGKVNKTTDAVRQKFLNNLENVI